MATQRVADTSGALVLAALRGHAFTGPSCCPSQALLAAEIGLRRETVNRACKHLERNGLLAIGKRRRPGAKWDHNVYVLRTRWTTPNRRAILRRLDQIRGRQNRAICRHDHTERTTTPLRSRSVRSTERSENSNGDAQVDLGLSEWAIWRLRNAGKWPV